MRNRIRTYRHRRGLTLRELAEAINTTPQSVSRLETGNMTLSTQWLERFAGALRVHPTELLEGPGTRQIEILGTVSGAGIVHPGRLDAISLDAGGADPVAVRITQAIGLFQRGDLLIGERLQAADLSQAEGRICIVRTTAGMIMLRRLAAQAAARRAVGRGADGVATNDVRRFNLLPLDSGDSAAAPAVIYDAPLEWAARITMRISWY